MPDHRFGCDDAFELLTRVDGAVPAEAARLERHLATCPACRELATRTEPAVELLRRDVAVQQLSPAPLPEAGVAMRRGSSGPAWGLTCLAATLLAGLVVAGVGWSTGDHRTSVWSERTPARTAAAPTDAGRLLLAKLQLPARCGTWEQWTTVAATAEVEARDRCCTHCHHAARPSGVTLAKLTASCRACHDS